MLGKADILPDFAPTKDRNFDLEPSMRFWTPETSNICTPRTQKLRPIMPKGLSKGSRLNYIDILLSNNPTRL
jgi:hypothetical protein